MKEPMIRAANRQALIDAIGSYIVASEDDLSPDAPYLKLEMAECGKVVEYWTEEEIPETSVPCPCGDPEHWMILYGEGERGV
ncbi:MAG: hypothetical protein ABIH46_04095 [Chloroflexota bacterium]